MVMGEKKYTMVKHMDPLDVCSFNVEVKTEPSSADPDKTYPNFMDVEVYNLKIRISNSLVVTVSRPDVCSVVTVVFATLAVWCINTTVDDWNIVY